MESLTKDIFCKVRRAATRLGKEEEAQLTRQGEPDNPKRQVDGITSAEVQGSGKILAQV
jgi:hypothetical protein